MLALKSTRHSLSQTNFSGRPRKSWLRARAERIPSNRRLTSMASAVAAWILGSLGFEAGAQEKLRIMPLGDSITQGLTSSDHYRRHLWAQLKSAGAVEIDFVGSHQLLQGNSGDWRTGFDKDHEGHSGWHANHLLWGGGWNQGGSGKLDTWLGNLRNQGRLPHIVLLHIGTNDVLWETPNDAQTIQEIKAIIDKVRSYQPDVKVLVARLIPHKDGSKRSVNALNSLIWGLGTYDTPRSEVKVVDHHTGFYTSWLSDLYHPNTTGAQFMASRWADALLQPGWAIAPTARIHDASLDPASGTKRLTFAVEPNRHYAVESRDENGNWVRQETFRTTSAFHELSIPLDEDSGMFRVTSLVN